MKRSLANTVATILGIGFILVGLVGLIAPSLMGMHLSLSHDLVHLISGAAALYFGLAGSVRAAKLFNLIFGTVYLLLGVVGFLAGHSGSPSPGVPGPSSSNLLKVIAGSLELGTADHSVHILLGLVFIVGALLTKQGDRPASERR
jgi:hypothetical protein